MQQTYQMRDIVESAKCQTRWMLLHNAEHKLGLGTRHRDKNERFVDIKDILRRTLLRFHNNPNISIDKVLGAVKTEMSEQVLAVKDHAALTDFESKLQTAAGILNNYIQTFTGHQDLEVLEVRPDLTTTFANGQYKLEQTGDLLIMYGDDVFLHQFLFTGQNLTQDTVNFYSYLSEQTRIRLWAAHKQHNAMGVLTTIVRTKAPVVPELLKNGKALSRNKSIDTTWAVYQKAIIDHGFEVSDYVELRGVINEKETARPFLRRVPGLTVNDAFMARTEQLLGHRLAQLSAIKDHVVEPIPATTPVYCPQCPIRRACEAYYTDSPEQAGAVLRGDVQFTDNNAGFSVTLVGS